MVADNQSIARAYWMGAHLINTFALLGALTVLWWLSSRPIFSLGETPSTCAPLPGQRAFRWGALGILAVAVTGALVALGDTLFPVDTVAEGLAQDLDPTSHPLLRLRVIHPVMAVGVAVFLIYKGLQLLQTEEWSPTSDKACRSDIRTGRILALRPLLWGLCGLLGTQLAIGVVNWLLMAPLYLQLVHLLMADLVWMALVILIACGRPRRYQAPAKPA